MYVPTQNLKFIASHEISKNYLIIQNRDIRKGMRIRFPLHLGISVTTINTNHV